MRFLKYYFCGPWVWIVWGCSDCNLFKICFVQILIHSVSLLITVWLLKPTCTQILQVFHSAFQFRKGWNTIRKEHAAHITTFLIYNLRAEWIFDWISDICRSLIQSPSATSFVCCHPHYSHLLVSRRQLLFSCKWKLSPKWFSCLNVIYCPYAMFYCCVVYV